MVTGDFFSFGDRELSFRASQCLLRWAVDDAFHFNPKNHKIHQFFFWQKKKNRLQG